MENLGVGIGAYEVPKAKRHRVAAATISRFTPVPDSEEEKDPPDLELKLGSPQKSQRQGLTRFKHKLKRES